ncbi:MAG: universal stress protein [Bacteroidetes bacterium]|nr:universal stress protein [Bacteroidota bacterium]
MKKRIILAMEGDRLATSALRYAIDIAKDSGSVLIGVFLRDLKYAGFTYATMLGTDTTGYAVLGQAEKAATEKNIGTFEQKCSAAGVSHHVLMAQDAPIGALIEESAFADLIITDARMNISSLLPDAPSSSLRDILVDAHCPILIVPNTYRSIRHTTLSYDGSPASVYALRAFRYIFPEWADHRTTLLSVVDKKEGTHLKDNNTIRELTDTHYPNIKYQVLKGEPTTAITKYMKKDGADSVIVMGAYGRNALSRLMHQSLSNALIKEAKVPIFIAHQ